MLLVFRLTTENVKGRNDFNNLRMFEEDIVGLISFLQACIKFISYRNYECDIKLKRLMFQFLFTGYICTLRKMISSIFKFKKIGNLKEKLKHQPLQSLHIYCLQQFHFAQYF